MKEELYVKSSIAELEDKKLISRLGATPFVIDLRRDKFGNGKTVSAAAAIEGHFPGKRDLENIDPSPTVYVCVDCNLTLKSRLNHAKFNKLKCANCQDYIDAKLYT